MPAFLVACTLTVLFRAEVANASPADVIAVYGFAQIYYPSRFSGEFTPAWSLDIEMAFYVALPVAMVLIQGARRLGSPLARTRVLLAGTIALLAGGLWLRANGPAAPPLCTPEDMLYAFMPGIALAVIEPLGAPGLAQWSTRASRLLPAGLLVLSLVGFIGYASYTQDLFARYAFSAVLSGGLVAAALTLQWSRGRTWAILDNAASRWLAPAPTASFSSISSSSWSSARSSMGSIRHGGRCYCCSGWRCR